MLTSTPDKIIGKKLIAQNPVKLYRGNATSVNDYYNIISVGEEIGTVASFKIAYSGAPVMYQFFDNNNEAFFAIDTPGAFIVKQASTKTYLIILAVAIGSYFIFRNFSKSRN